MDDLICRGHLGGQAGSLARLEEQCLEWKSNEGMI